VASVVAATHLGYKRRRSGTHVVPATAQAAAAPPPVAAPVAAPIRAAAAEPPALKLRRKTAGLGPKAAKKALGGVPVVKKVTSRKKPAPKPQIDDPPPAAHDVLDEMATPTGSFMGLLNDAEVNIGAPPLKPFDFEDDDLEEEEEEEEGEEEVAEIGGEAFAAAAARPPIMRATNYSEAEDILLVRAWAAVGMDASTGTDQTGKRYWQRIEDTYCKLKPKTGGFAARTFRSLQGRWELMKPACARWSAAMTQVIDSPPSGSVESDYVSAHLFSMSMLLFTMCVYYAFVGFVGDHCRPKVHPNGRFQGKIIPIQACMETS
jgi:hypothetical protein